MVSSNRALLGAVLSLTSASSAKAGVIEQRQSDCSAVHIFLSRGNNEPYPGRQGKLVSAICGKVSNCDYEDIHFDNALATNFCRAVEDGASAGISQITAYNQRCPETKLVISGYSQGAQVVGDILGGGGGAFFEGCVQSPNTGLNPYSAPGSMIKAALLFGDTRHTGGQSYNILSGSPYNGLFPRGGSQLSDLNRFAGVMRDYCPAEDPICALGNVVEDHLNYFDIYSDDAATWVANMVGNSDTPPTSTTTQAPETSTSTSTTFAPPSSTSTKTTETQLEPEPTTSSEVKSSTSTAHEPEPTTSYTSTTGASIPTSTSATGSSVPTSTSSSATVTSVPSTSDSTPETIATSETTSENPHTGSPLPEATISPSTTGPATSSTPATVDRSFAVHQTHPSLFMTVIMGAFAFLA